MFRSWLARRLYRLARSDLLGKSLGFMFEHLSFALPVRKLRETPTLIAFYHPQPSYRVHILLVPKRAIPSLAELEPGDAGFLNDLFAAVGSLAAELGLEQNGYRLVVNGGKYQQLPQLHFHLIAD